MTQQLRIGDLVTGDVVRDAVNKARKREKHSKSWEDDFDFQVRSHKLPRIARKALFAKSIGRHWEADFCYEGYKLLIEIDGGVWRRGGGAHSHPTNILRDMEKQNDATLLGYSVLRFTSDEVKKGYAIEFLMRVLISRGWSGPQRPPPLPSGPPMRQITEGVRQT